MSPLGALLVAAALLRPLEASPQTIPACWSFGLTAYRSTLPLFPSIRLAEDGRAILDRGTGEATWTRMGDTVRVASGSGFQRWTLTFRHDLDIVTATLRRWEDDPHGSPEPPIDFRAVPFPCDSVEWPSVQTAMYDAPPRLLNNAELDGAFRQNNRDEFGVRRSAKVMLLVDELGKVLDIRLEQTTGLLELDEAALRTADVAQFAPAMLGGRPVAARTALWFRFR